MYINKKIELESDRDEKTFITLGKKSIYNDDLKTESDFQIFTTTSEPKTSGNDITFRITRSNKSDLCVDAKYLVN